MGYNKSFRKEVQRYEAINGRVYIRTLQAEYDDFITFPRQFNLKRIPCIAHTLQLPIQRQEEGGEHLQLAG